MKRDIVKDSKDWPIQSMNPTDIWNSYQHIQEHEHHFNILQQKYRFLTSTWLLATLGAVGYLIRHTLLFATDPSTSSHVSVGETTLLTAMIAVGGAGGIRLIWGLDIVLYHRLLDAGHIVGSWMECAFPHVLPPIRTNMGHLLRPSGGGMRLIKWFYAGSMIACLAILCVSVLLSVPTQTLPHTPYPWSIFVALLCYWIWHVDHDTKSMNEFLSILEKAKLSGHLYAHMDQIVSSESPDRKVSRQSRRLRDELLAKESAVRKSEFWTKLRVAGAVSALSVIGTVLSYAASTTQAQMQVSWTTQLFQLLPICFLLAHFGKRSLSYLK